MRHLHVHESGSRSGIPIVFLHAFPLHDGMWDAQRGALSRARCIGFDARGLGRSALTTHAFMLEHMVDDLFAVLDELGVASAVLCGLSMGGYVALRAVEREPERVRGLLLADTQAAADADQAKLARADGVRALRDGELGAYADAQLKRVLCSHTHAHKPHVVQAAREMILAARAEGISGALVALATRTDVSDGLAQIRVPTSVLVGNEDAVTPPAVARKLAAAIPGAELHVLEQAGHLSNLEAPEAFDQLLSQLVTRVEGT